MDDESVSCICSTAKRNAHCWKLAQKHRAFLCRIKTVIMAYNVWKERKMFGRCAKNSIDPIPAMLRKRLKPLMYSLHDGFSLYLLQNTDCLNYRGMIPKITATIIQMMEKPHTYMNDALI